jgi:hypothetical protein
VPQYPYGDAGDDEGRGILVVPMGEGCSAGLGLAALQREIGGSDGRAKRAWAVGIATLVAVVVVASAAGALPGKIVAKGSASGQFAIASARATVARPKALYVRLVGRIESGTFIVGCSRGLSISSNSYTRNRQGLYQLPIKPRRARTCNITGSIGGSGPIRLEIRVVR